MLVKIVTTNSTHLYSCTSLSHSSEKLSLSLLFIDPAYEPYEAIGFPASDQQETKADIKTDVTLLDLVGPDKKLAIKKASSSVFVMNDQGQTIDHISK